MLQDSGQSEAGRISKGGLISSIVSVSKKADFYLYKEFRIGVFFMAKFSAEDKLAAVLALLTGQ